MPGPTSAAGLLAWAQTQTWAMEPRALDAMTGALVALSQGQAVKLEAPSLECFSKPPMSLSEAMIAAASPRQSSARESSAVAVLPISGPISYHPSIFSKIFGGTSIMELTRELRFFMEDKSVKSILMPISSPGGTVTGVPEFAATVLAARTKKRITAVVDPVCASAALWLASAASEIISIPTGETGSLGVLSLHLDLSERMKQDGVKATYISSTPEKVEGNSFEPLSAAARADMQEGVDRYYRQFLAGVARGRGLGVETVRANFGRGRMLDSDKARSVGMIDKIMTFDRAVAVALGSQRPGAVAPSPLPRAAQTKDAAYYRRRLEELRNG